MIAQILLAHLVGDYILQNHWMAVEKTSRWFPAIVHGVVYTLPFMFITLDPLSLFIICSTHVVIDRLRLAKYVVWVKNQIAPKRFRSSEVSGTGFDESVPVWLATWLMIITDNVIHILINYAAIVFV